MDCVCVLAVLFSQANLSSGECAGDPQQVQGLEGHQDEADIGCQVLGTLWVHEVVGGVAACILLIAHRGGQVDPEGHIDRTDTGNQTMLEVTPKTDRHGQRDIKTLGKNNRQTDTMKTE